MSDKLIDNAAIYAAIALAGVALLTCVFAPWFHKRRRLFPIKTRNQSLLMALALTNLVACAAMLLPTIESNDVRRDAEHLRANRWWHEFMYLTIFTLLGNNYAWRMVRFLARHRRARAMLNKRGGGGDAGAAAENAATATNRAASAVAAAAAAASTFDVSKSRKAANIVVSEAADSLTKESESSAGADPSAASTTTVDTNSTAKGVDPDDDVDKAVMPEPSAVQATKLNELNASSSSAAALSTTSSDDDSSTLEKTEQSSENVEGNDADKNVPALEEFVSAHFSCGVRSAAFVERHPLIAFLIFTTIHQLVLFGIAIAVTPSLITLTFDLDGGDEFALNIFNLCVAAFELLLCFVLSIVLHFVGEATWMKYELFMLVPIWGVLFTLSVVGWFVWPEFDVNVVLTLGFALNIVVSFVVPLVQSMACCARRRQLRARLRKERLRQQQLRLKRAKLKAADIKKKKKRALAASKSKLSVLPSLPGVATGAANSSSGATLSPLSLPPSMPPDPESADNLDVEPMNISSRSRKKTPRRNLRRHTKSPRGESGLSPRAGGVASPRRSGKRSKHSSAATQAKSGGGYDSSKLLRSAGAARAADASADNSSGGSSKPRRTSDRDSPLRLLTVLQYPEVALEFTDFLVGELEVHLLTFVQECLEFRLIESEDERREAASDILQQYVFSSAKDRVDMGHVVRKKLIKEALQHGILEKSVKAVTTAPAADMFDEAWHAIAEQLEMDALPRFAETNAYLSLIETMAARGDDVTALLREGAHHGSSDRGSSGVRSDESPYSHVGLLEDSADGYVKAPPPKSASSPYQTAPMPATESDGEIVMQYDEIPAELRESQEQ